MDDNTDTNYVTDVNDVINMMNSITDKLGNITKSDFDVSVKECNRMILGLKNISYLVKSIENKQIDSGTRRRQSKRGKKHKNICYICKGFIHSEDLRHPIKKSHCVNCGNHMLNAKLNADQTGRVAIVTGGRVKIGFETALILLRNGATVLVTTRFVDDCYERYSKEKDFESFKDRLHIYQLNLMLVDTHVRAFIKYVKENYTRIDYLINNAAQTIRRPNAFYQHVIDKCSEYDTPLIKHRNVDELKLCFDNTRIDDKLLPYECNGEDDKDKNKTVLSVVENIDKLFPPGEFDEFGQQIDLRRNNTWTAQHENVPIEEVLEVLLVNLAVPYMLCGELKELMGYADDTMNKSHMSWIVNVTATEGKLNQKRKPSRHPHTNMAKYALEMMTRTSGRNYFKSGIVMIGVDTGWNNSQMPGVYDETPLNCKDGAWRILHPVFNRLMTHSVTYKNYVIDKRF
jgi:NAD(P)-dependent dehydrogenase (short-subunit alcohol dehydrogenase family)